MATHTTSNYVFKLISPTHVSIIKWSKWPFTWEGHVKLEGRREDYHNEVNNYKIALVFTFLISVSLLAFFLLSHSSGIATDSKVIVFFPFVLSTLLSVIFVTFKNQAYISQLSDTEIIEAERFYSVYILIVYSVVMLGLIPLVFWFTFIDVPSFVLSLGFLVASGLFMSLVYFGVYYFNLSYPLRKWIFARLRNAVKVSESLNLNRDEFIKDILTEEARKVVRTIRQAVNTEDQEVDEDFLLDLLPRSREQKILLQLPKVATWMLWVTNIVVGFLGT